MRKFNKILIVLIVLISLATLFTFYKQEASETLEEAKLYEYFDNLDIKIDKTTLSPTDTDKVFTVNYKKFSTTSNAFCINKGDAFSSNVTFKKQNFYAIVDGNRYYYNGTEYTTKEIGDIKTRTDSYLNTLGVLGKYNQVSYVLSEVPENQDRDSLKTHPYQLAIWKICNAVQFSDCTEEVIKEADKLVANAEAYASFVEKRYANLKPIIDTENAKIIEADGKKLLGPINVEYLSTTVIVNGVTGNYGEITKLELTETSNNKTIAIEKVYDKNGKELSADKKLGKYAKSSQDFYIDVTDYKADSYKLNATFNNQYRNAYLYVISTDGEIRQSDLKEYQNVIVGRGTKSDTTYEVEIEPKVEKMNLSGKVWLDAQTGIKPTREPDGKNGKDEAGIEGVKVYLYKEDGTLVKTDADGKTIGNSGYLITDADGKYEFIGIAKDSYYIVFEYDGINYIRTIDGDSKATELNRDTFDARFKEISKDKSNDGTKLSYNYSENKSELITTNTDKTALAEFAITAKTNTYNETTENIDYGVQKRGVDLSVISDVYEAKVTINGLETTYDYNEIIKNDGDLTILGDNKSDDGVKYNLYLYASDYNYRILDYTNGEFIPEGDLENPGQELEVYVTYKIMLNNQSSANAKVNSIIDYYDSNYTVSKVEYEKLSGEKGNLTHKAGAEKQIDGKTYKSLKITGLESLALNGGEQNIIYITFKVNKDENSAVILNEYANIVEITSYSTSKGLIDIDSAPDNAITENKLRYEDDTDVARNIKISIAEDKQREIEGTVWDDSEISEDGTYVFGDGILNSEQLINGITVQLIEIKEINGKNYEYIWQETTTGGDKVYRLSANGEVVKEYNVENEEGKYSFKDFIPGNYIVRFIYGENAGIDYNGQDYKSTTDLNYEEEWYDKTKYQANASVARDNEARRLEVMSKSAYIDSDTMTNIEDFWMCAETSKIKVGMHEGKIDAINFGLENRPKTVITLEKHITALRITANDGTPLIDAKVDIANIGSVNTAIEGIRTGLTAIASNKSSKGYWSLATDIEELIQGAKLEVVYTYLMGNNSQDDYISTTLSNLYKENPLQYGQELAKIAEQAEKDIKTNTHSIGKYLGETYYNANTEAENVEKVVTRIENVEDYINNNLEFVAESSVGFEKTNTESVSKTIYDDAEIPVEINTVIATSNPTQILNVGDVEQKTTLLTTTLSSTGNLDIESYIAQVMAYTNSAGRRDELSIPGNLKYITTNLGTIESDEAWGEKITITKPFGEDRTATIAITVIVALTVVAVGVVAIKKYVIK